MPGLAVPTGTLTRREGRPRLPRHCERSEAIHRAASGEVDCFAALAITTKYDIAISRRISPEVCVSFGPL
jgi:hypothetical protein